MKVLKWSEIDQAPETPGVYAWYSRLVISKADIEDIVKRVQMAQQESESKARAEVESGWPRRRSSWLDKTDYHAEPANAATVFIPNIFPIEESFGDVSESRIARIMDCQDFAGGIAAGLGAARRPANHLAKQDK